MLIIINNFPSEDHMVHFRPIENKSGIEVSNVNSFTEAEFFTRIVTFFIIHESILFLFQPMG